MLDNQDFNRHGRRMVAMGFFAVLSNIIIAAGVIGLIVWIIKTVLEKV